MIQINQPPVQIAFNFHDIPELDLECVDETENPESDAKNFIQTKHFDLLKFYKHSFLMCSYESGSIVGTPFYSPYKIQMRYNHIKGSLSCFNCLKKNKMIFVVDKYNLYVIETKIITPDMIEGKSKMEIESEVVKIVFNVTYPQAITLIKVVDDKIFIGTDQGYFDILYINNNNQFYIISNEPEVRHLGPITDIEVTDKLIITQSTDNTIHVWNHEK